MLQTYAMAATEPPFNPSLEAQDVWRKQTPIHQESCPQILQCIKVCSNQKTFKQVLPTREGGRREGHK